MLAAARADRLAAPASRDARPSRERRLVAAALPGAPAASDREFRAPGGVVGEIPMEMIRLADAADRRADGVVLMERRSAHDAVPPDRDSSCVSPRRSISTVPDAIWWRVALICLHSQWPLLRPCRVVLPVRLAPGEREFWLRMCDAESRRSRPMRPGRRRPADRHRRVRPGARVARAGVPATLAVAPASAAGATASRRRRCCRSSASRPLLVTVASPREGSIEHETARRHAVMPRSSPGAGSSWSRSTRPCVAAGTTCSR